ncbi:hypothetical protein AU210_012243 [Fusarium oxysporum f. sp. radicis-cucumerinum]|uniref:Uncharacterized protein n=1 Tax=Fusarium oxysporum f. sp. radicis-cucumerinum TaxID=327505 RepID=A0A2H3G4N1_FUSOX|nr:hypothetical protein AU210_012243 [Fusarium oxysporum f. sp. radicis-cucumerinum]
MLILRRDAAFERSTGQVSCDLEDLTRERERQDLMKLPVGLMPESAFCLLTLFYKTYNEKVNDWARQRSFNIKKPVYLGPQILLLQSGDVQLQDDRISVVIFIPRPKSTQDKEGTVVADEEITMRTKSLVGDIVILEGGERLSWRDNGGLPERNKDVCMLCALHQTNKVAPEKKDTN